MNRIIWSKSVVSITLLIFGWIPWPAKPGRPQVSFPAGLSPYHVDEWGRSIKRDIINPLRRLTGKGVFPTVLMPINRIAVKDEVELQWPVYDLINEGLATFALNHHRLAYYRERIQRRSMFNAKRKLAKLSTLYQALKTGEYNPDNDDPVIVYQAGESLVRNGGSHRIAILAHLGHEEVNVVLLTRDTVLNCEQVPEAVKQSVLSLDPPK